MTQTTAPQLSEEAWIFLKSQDLYTQDDDEVTFEGDWGNWNWLFSEIFKRCKND